MRKSFTLFEAIIVIVVIGILAAVAMPRLETDNLQEAADKMISAIRYTQHLALIDNKYIPNKNFSNFPNDIQKEKETKFWFKGWWCFYLRDFNGDSSTANDSLSGPDITIFSDTPSANNNNLYNKNPSKSEIAKDPQTGKLACGHKFDSGFKEKDIDRSYNLNISYNISKIVVNSKCKSRDSLKIYFDDLGRPHCAKPNKDSSFNPYTKIMKNQTKIRLCVDENCNESINICIEPITGYVHYCV